MSRKKLNKRMQTLIAKHGKEEATALVRLWTSKAGATRGKPKGFSVSGKAREAAYLSAEAKRRKRDSKTQE